MSRRTLIVVTILAFALGLVLVTGLQSIHKKEIARVRVVHEEKVKVENRKEQLRLENLQLENALLKKRLKDEGTPLPGPLGSKY